MARLLERIPAEYREDAAQEAWLAHLEGRGPVKAMDAFRKRQERYDARFTPFTALGTK